MVYGRKTIDKKGVSRYVCIKSDCTRRVSEPITNRNSNINNYNYCARHQPIDVLANLENNIQLPNNWLEFDDNFKLFIEAHFKLEGLDINNNNDIYNFEVTKLKKYAGCHGILNKTWDINSSPCRGLKNVPAAKLQNACIKLRIIHLFPEKELRVIYFKILPNNIVEGNLELQKEIIQDFFESKKRDFTIENIYNITLAELENHKSGTLFNHCNHSPYKLFNALYPELKLEEYYFSGFKYHFVDETDGLKKDNIRDWFMKEIYSKYTFPVNSSEYDNIKEILLHIRCQDIQKVKGCFFFGNKMNASVYTFITLIFPEYNIKSYELKRVPRGEISKEQLKDILELLKDEKNITIHELYNYLLSNKSILKCYIKMHSLYRLYQDPAHTLSYEMYIQILFTQCYPMYTFSNENFKKNKKAKLRFNCQLNPNNNNDRKKIQQLIDEMLTRLQLKTIDDHYKIRSQNFRDNDLEYLIRKYYDYNYVKLLTDIYPENEYVVSKFKNASFNHTLFVLISEIFEELGLVINKSTFEYKFNDLTSICGNKLRFDLAIEIVLNNSKCIWLFEKDGQQHFEPVKHFGGTEKFKIQRANDILKNKYVASKSYNLLLFRISYKETRHIETFKRALKKMVEHACDKTTNKVIVSNEKMYTGMLNE